MLRCFTYPNYSSLIDSDATPPESPKSPILEVACPLGPLETNNSPLISNQLGGSTGTLIQLSAAPNSAPSSTSLTPELKRPPNHKLVKHLEASLLKNSISDSQLHRRCEEEDRYVKVPTLGTVPPPRPSVPCPKKKQVPKPESLGDHPLPERPRSSVSPPCRPSAPSPTQHTACRSIRKCAVPPVMIRSNMAPANSELNSAAAGAGAGGATTSPSTQRTWLHSDNDILVTGVTYTVRYVGCLEVLTSMKSLDFETRTLIAKECIIRVCEAAGLKSVDKKRKLDRRLTRILAEKPIMEHAGSNVKLRINSASLGLIDMETSEVIAEHAMPNISFASGGDAETLDFVAYVGKDDRHARACFVLECGGGLAQDVIATIGQAFELRFREFMRRSPLPVPTQCVLRSSDPDYYNDLPGKMPPEAPKNNNEVAPCGAAGGTGVTKRLSPNNNSGGGMQTDLIDLNNADSLDPSRQPPTHDYVNTAPLDPFDMCPLSEILPNTSAPSQPGTQSPPLVLVDPPPPAHVVANIEQQLMKEAWYHGAISRAESEALLHKDGDFLVRESQGQKGQFVLTGLQGGSSKHLLLIDPQGVVRTKERTFSSVGHLIDFHRDNQLPILSAESALLLVTPVSKPGPAAAASASQP